mmetsp:Transcript_25292/g.35328  ORF Transcript_25292/g.35328 Transcript_25292/m.35328 type:complete len:86 (-) Transcript_25292:550-807(-)
MPLNLAKSRKIPNTSAYSAQMRVFKFKSYRSLSVSLAALLQTCSVRSAMKSIMQKASYHLPFFNDLRIRSTKITTVTVFDLEIID